MRRIQLLKCMILVVVAFAAVVARGDVPRPSYHALSRSAWEARQFNKHEFSVEINGLMHKIVETIKKATCGNEIIVLLASCVLSLLGVTVCVAFFPRAKTPVLTFLLILVFVSLGLMCLVFSDYGTIVVTDSVAPEGVLGNTRDDITVNPEPSETYEEYIRRVYKYNNPTYRCKSCGGETSYLIGGSHCDKCERRFREQMDTVK